MSQFKCLHQYILSDIDFCIWNKLIDNIHRKRAWWFISKMEVYWETKLKNKFFILEADASENGRIAGTETAVARHTETRTSQFLLLDAALVASTQQEIR